MSEGRDVQLWNYTCNVAAKIHNCWLEPKVTAEQLHPYGPRTEPQVEELTPKETVQYLKRAYGG